MLLCNQVIVHSKFFPKYYYFKPYYYFMNFFDPLHRADCDLILCLWWPHHPLIPAAVQIGIHAVNAFVSHQPPREHVGKVEGERAKSKRCRKAEEARVCLSHTAWLVKVMILKVLFLELPSILVCVYVCVMPLNSYDTPCFCTFPSWMTLIHNISMHAFFQTDKVMASKGKICAVGYWLTNVVDNTKQNCNDFQ